MSGKIPAGVFETRAGVHASDRFFFSEFPGASSIKYVCMISGVICILSLGCQNASSPAPPPASSKKIDVHVDAPGVKVDVNGKKQEP